LDNSGGGGWNNDNFGFDYNQGGGGFNQATAGYNQGGFDQGGNSNNNNNMYNQNNAYNNNNNMNYGYNDYNDNNMMMMQRNSLMGNYGGGMMQRGSMGFGYNGGYSNYNNYGYGNQMPYNNQGYGYQQQGMHNVGNQGMDGSNHNQIDGNAANKMPDNLEDIQLDDEDPEQNIDYLAARAHAAQMLAQEESKRLEDNLKRLEMRRKLSAMNNVPNPNKASKTQGQSDNGAGFSGGAENSNSHKNNMLGGMVPQQGTGQINQGMGQQVMQQQGQATPQGYYNQGNSNVMNNNSNITQSKDEYLFERSRMNNYQMNMRNVNNNNNMPDNNNNAFNQNFQNNNTMNMGYNNFNPGYPGYPMMPPMNMMMGDYSQGQMNTMGGITGNNAMNNFNSTDINTNNATLQAKLEKKKRKRPTISDPSDLPVVPPPKPKKEVITAPRRPLSAYNIFFSEMRDTIVKEHLNATDAEKDGEHKDDSNPAEESSEPINADSNDTTKIESDTAVMPAPNRDMQDFTQALMKKRLSDAPQRRAHRKTHGKIPFTSLAQLVGRRWKELPEESKKRYKELAELDRERYKKEKARAQKAMREEQRLLRKQAKRVHTGTMGATTSGSFGEEGS
jgi:hypothetical protein